MLRSRGGGAQLNRLGTQTRGWLLTMDGWRSNCPDGIISDTEELFNALPGKPYQRDLYSEFEFKPSTHLGVRPVPNFKSAGRRWQRSFKNTAIGRKPW